jgi:hypothetical protein
MKNNNEKSFDILKNELECLKKEQNIFLIQKAVKNIPNFSSIEKPLFFDVNIIHKDIDGIKFNVECSEINYENEVIIDYSEIEHYLNVSNMEFNEENCKKCIDDCINSSIYF